MTISIHLYVYIHLEKTYTIFILKSLDGYILVEMQSLSDQQNEIIKLLSQKVHVTCKKKCILWACHINRKYLLFNFKAFMKRYR